MLTFLFLSLAVDDLTGGQRHDAYDGDDNELHGDGHWFGYSVRSVPFAAGTELAYFD